MEYAPLRAKLNYTGYSREGNPLATAVVIAITAPFAVVYANLSVSPT